MSLVNSFHMDHAASLPYVLAKTNFAAPVYMTHPTKAIYKHLMQDSVRIQSAQQASSGGTDGYTAQLFSEHDVLATLPQIQTLSFHTTHTHAGIKFSAYPAGHVLGACMYLIEIAGVKILFTGDYSRENNRHLIPASLPPNVKIDCLITESTFGISTHVPRMERESALLKALTTILNRGGRALMPVFAIGGAQELLLILEDYWHRHPELHQFPIYFASSLARKCMVVYQTYIDSMNENIRSKASSNITQGEAGGPWDFTHIRSLKSLARFDDLGPCVMLASPGMLQNGVSRALLERWAPDARNGVVVTGYSVEGTMAKSILTEPDVIPAVMSARQGMPGAAGKRGAGSDGEAVMIPRRCSVQEFSFAAHVDGTENREFIEEVDAGVVILVHGERHNMNRLKSRLLGLSAKGERRWKVFSPANCEEVRVRVGREKVVRVVGRLASHVQQNGVDGSGGEMEGVKAEGEEEDVVDGGVKRKQDGQAEEGQLMTGVLVQNDFQLSLMAPEDLKEYAGLTTTKLICRQRITLAAAGVELIRWALEGMFGSVSSSEKNDAEATVFEIMGGAVRILCKPHGEVEVEWEGNATNDGLADAVMAVLLEVESSPAAVRFSSRVHSHSHSHSGNEEDEYDAFGDSTTAKKSNGTGRRARNPLSNLTAEEKLSRLFLFLEAQFGEEAITPIAQPKLPSPSPSSVDEIAQAKELARLHALGLPVPGLEIRVEKHVAKLWLEGLEVECANRTFADRVRAVVERALETVAVGWE